MGFWQRLMDFLSDGAVSPEPRYEENQIFDIRLPPQTQPSQPTPQRQPAHPRYVAPGSSRSVCPECYTRIFHYIDMRPCPTCGYIYGGPRPMQIIRNYRNASQFQQEAASLARAGWYVASQSQGGLRHPGVVGYVLLGGFATRGAKDFTVVYQRR